MSPFPYLRECATLGRFARDWTETTLALSMPILLLALVLGAPGDIYRCSDVSGKVSFQDQPCARGAQSAHLASGNDDAKASQMALQQWLDSHREHRAPNTPATGARSVRPPFGNGAISEAQLAMCSERFLHCAQGNDDAMDACVASLPRCGTGGSAPCCPQACVSRYQSLRRDGNALATSVKLALLDPDAPACAAPL